MEIKTNCYAAVDIGASSGRVVIGEVTPQGTIELTEIHRFDNIQKRSGGHDCWDVDMRSAKPLPAWQNAKKQVTRLKPWVSTPGRSISCCSMPKTTCSAMQ